MLHTGMVRNTVHEVSEEAPPKIVSFQSRAFVILATADHAAIIDRRLRELTGRGSPWGDHFRLHGCS